MSQLNIEARIGQSLKSLGFKKKGRVWLLDKGSFIQLATLTKSRFGNIFYLDAGVVVKGYELEALKYPAYWHISTRPEMLHKDPEYFMSAFDLDSGLEPEARGQRLEEAVQEIRRGIFERFHDLESIVSCLHPQTPSIVCNERILKEVKERKP